MPSPDPARPAASVIIPARNEATTIARLVHAVLDQAPPGVGVEVLVVDDGSADDTPAVARAAGARVLELGSRAGGGNLPLKIFDYLAANRPIVATDIPTHRTVLSDQRAVLVAPRPEALADGILAVLGDPGHAAKLSAAAREYARVHLGWGRFVDAVSELYEDVERHALA